MEPFCRVAPVKKGLVSMRVKVYIFMCVLQKLLVLRMSITCMDGCNCLFKAF
jgi:hypothetical protein